MSIEIAGAEVVVSHESAVERNYSMCRQAVLSKNVPKCHQNTNDRKERKRNDKNNIRNTFEARAYCVNCGSNGKKRQETRCHQQNACHTGEFIYHRNIRVS
jgi:hypothetical protein